MTENHSAVVIYFHLAPVIATKKGEGYHEWLIEFETKPKSIKDFSADLCAALQSRNSYYKDLVSGGVIKSASVTALKKKAFVTAMASLGKLGGQNKIPRLSNDRKLADLLTGSTPQIKAPAKKAASKKPAVKKPTKKK